MNKKLKGTWKSKINLLKEWYCEWLILLKVNLFKLQLNCMLRNLVSLSSNYNYR